MTRSPDILFLAEYIKNVLYFATVREGKTLKSSSETHYFTIDDQLLYENYYSDFGPLNLGCVYKYCTILNEKLNQYLNKQIIIVHYTSTDPKKKANAAFLLGCYGVIYLSLLPKDALKPLTHGQSYRPFQDATQGDSSYTISLLDCLQAIAKARELGFFNFQDFNYEEYERLDRIQGGDLNWIVPAKFLAFVGPVDLSVNFLHPPEIYVSYFKDNNVKIVIRLNKRFYDSATFSNAGITHYDLFFPDGTCPPRHILMKFLQISELCDGAIAVHCKAGLGRTGSLIGCYLIKHYRMSAREAIGWMRICRPGSVIGQQQGWLEHLEVWLLKQGNLYRKRTYSDVDRVPKHEFGLYSIAERTHKQRPVTFTKSPSPPPPIQRQTRSDISPPLRPHASKIREEGSEIEDIEVFLTSCDLTVKSKVPLTQMKGCVIKSAPVAEDEVEHFPRNIKTPLWKSVLCCQPCTKILKDYIWLLAVRCARVAPNTIPNNCCTCLDLVIISVLLFLSTKLVAQVSWACCYRRFTVEIGVIVLVLAWANLAPKPTAKKEQFEWHVKSPQINYRQKIPQRGIGSETSSTVSRRSGAGEPRVPRSPVRGHSAKSQEQRNSAKFKESGNKNASAYYPIPTFCTTHGPIIKNVTDAKNFLMRSSMYNEQRTRNLNSSITVTPQESSRISKVLNDRNIPDDMSRFTPSYYSTGLKGPTQPQHRRRLGRSPSPPSRATNTPTPNEKYHVKDSKTTLREALSRLKVSGPRDDSIGAASLGARREAPAPRRAPSVRSDERPLATQGDLLNSIKFQRRLRDRDFLQVEKFANYHDKNSVPSSTSKEKSTVRTVNSKTSSSLTKPRLNLDYSSPRDKVSSPAPGVPRAARPTSPKGRRNLQPSFY